MTHRLQRILFFLGAPLLLLMAAACAPASTPAPTAVPPTPTPLPLPPPLSAIGISPMGMSSSSGTPGGTELRGASLYEVSCAACHGAERAGSTLSKDGQNIDVPALNWDDLNQAYSTNPSRGSVEQQLALAITKGQDEDGNDLSTVMPRWSSLSQAQVSSLVDYLQSAGAATGAVPTLEPAATNLMGEQLYQQACAACHGADRGGKTLSQDGQNIDVPALGWSDLSSTYSAQPSRGTVEQQLALAITKGQDEEGSDMSTVMPRWSMLSEAQVGSLIQFLQAGETTSGSMPGSMPQAAGNAEITGAPLFELSCAACHGQDRAGQTFDMDGQKIDVPALAWSDLSGTYATDPSRGTAEQQVALSITKGQDETGGDLNAMMPRWSSLSQAQVDSLVQFLQKEDSTTGGVPTLTPEAANVQGQQLYAMACAACHGADAAGKDFEMDGNKISTPSLHWSELSSTYATDPSRGTVAQQVGISITKGQDETGGDLNTMMPRWSFLSQAQVDSLVQYLQTAFP